MKGERPDATRGGGGGSDDGGKPEGTTLEAALEVFEVFASGSLTDEVYVLDDVSGKRIAIAPRELKERYRAAIGQARSRCDR